MKLYKNEFFLKIYWKGIKIGFITRAFGSVPLHCDLKDEDKINDIIIFTENELFLAKNETFVSVFNLIATGDSFCKNLFFFSEIISFPLPKKKRECTIQYVGWSSDCEVLGFSNRGALRNHVFECCGALAFRLSSVLFSGKQAPLIFGIRFGF